MTYKSSLDDMLYEDQIKTVDDFVELLKSKGINTDQLDPILRSSGKLELIATAGAGKSSALSYVYALDKLIGILANPGEQNKGKRALVTTFLKDGALEMERKVQKTLGDLELFEVTISGTSFKNLHAEFRELLTIAMGKDAELKVLTDSSEGNLKRRIFEKLFRDFSLGINPNYPTNMEINTLAGLITRYRNTVISEFEFGDSQGDADDLNITVNRLKLIVEAYQRQKKLNDVIDFDDMVDTIYHYFANPETRIPKLYELYVNRYYYILLDEFQDTSELQYLTLKPLLENCERVIVVGDPDQSIYSFQGANPQVMKWFERDFQPEVLPLSVSYRCPTNILEPMRRVIENNTNRFNTRIKSFKDGGEIKCIMFDSLSDEARYTNEIIQKHLREGQSVVVQSRTNFAYSPALILYAIENSSNFNILGNATLLSHSRYKRVWGIKDLLLGRGVTNLARNLRVLDPEIKAYLARQMEDFSSNNISKKGSVLREFRALGEHASSHSLLALADSVDAVLSQPNVDELTVFKVLLEHIKLHGRERDAEVVDTLMTLVDVSSSLEVFMENMDFVNNAIKEANSTKTGVSLVTFATQHGFKGKEADVNIVFDVVDGVYPSYLSGEGSLEEERSCFFVAGTRGSKHTYVFTRKGIISPFVKEMAIPIEEKELEAEPIQIKSNTKTLRELRKAKELEELEADVDDVGLEDFEVF